MCPTWGNELTLSWEILSSNVSDVQVLSYKRVNAFSVLEPITQIFLGVIGSRHPLPQTNRQKTPHEVLLYVSQFRGILTNSGPWGLQPGTVRGDIGVRPCTAPALRSGAIMNSWGSGGMTRVKEVRKRLSAAVHAAASTRKKMQGGPPRIEPRRSQAGQLGTEQERRGGASLPYWRRHRPARYGDCLGPEAINSRWRPATSPSLSYRRHLVSSSQTFSLRLRPSPVLPSAWPRPPPPVHLRVALHLARPPR